MIRKARETPLYSINPRANTRDLPYAPKTSRNQFLPIQWTVGNDISWQEMSEQLPGLEGYVSTDGTRDAWPIRIIAAMLFKRLGKDMDYREIGDTSDLESALR